jgi:uncharacterized protein (TIGR02145 family)
MKKQILFLFALIFLGVETFSQNRASVIIGDTLRLAINNYRGTASWQESSDNQNWTDLSGSTQLLRYVPSTNIKWVRAKIEEENCPPFYEAPFLVGGIDTAAIDYNRNNLSIEQIESDLLSEDVNGLMLFDLSNGDFPLIAGDWLAGFTGQLTMKHIDAVIVQDGQARVYTSNSSVSVYAVPLNFGNTITGKVRGQVTDELGNPITFAEVRIGGQIQKTDIFGVFTFESVEMEERFGYVTATRAGYFPGSRTFIPKPNGTEVKINLLKTQTVGEFNASSGGTVSFENVQLQFPANAVTLNGDIYNGNMVVYANYIHPDSSTFYDEMPGNLIGNQYGNIRGLTSYGMMGIEIRTDTGLVLEVASGATITANFPISSEWLSTAPDTIDLWSFNEEQGIWIDEGSALKNGNVYTAQLPHFSFWNCDRPWEAVFLNGQLTDEFGNPLSQVIVTLSNQTIGSASDVTNYSGHFGGLVPANQELNISITYECGLGTSLTILTDSLLGSFSTDTSIVVNIVSPPELRNVRGFVKNCNNTALENGYVIHSGSVSYITNGSFAFIACSDTDSIKLVTEFPFLHGPWQTLSFSPGLNNLDTLTHCEGISIAFDTLSDVEGNVYNTVLIGDQWWMAENLKTHHYADGTLIPGYYGNSYDSCYPFSLDENNREIYGYQYNFYTVANPSNVCPTGWHVPSQPEFLELINAVGGQTEAFNNLSSNMLRNYPISTVTNAYGFTIIPAGLFDIPGSNWTWLGYMPYFWTSNEVESNTATCYRFYPSSTNIYPLTKRKSCGQSIRCVKD